ncbi:MAG: phage portal protein [bacterium]|nr:phage portal protein [bacterium]
MEIEVIRQLIQQYTPGHTDFCLKAAKGRHYYRNQTDILFEQSEKKHEQEENPLRNADNRIPFNFHGLLVNQKASYMFTAPPIFELGSKSANKQLTKFLGDKYAKVCKDLCIDASNCAMAWLHVWKAENEEWKYAVVPAEQIIPIWTKSLEKELAGVFRVYQEIDEVSGDLYTVYQYWNDTECQAYRLKSGDVLEHLLPYPIFMSVDPSIADASERYQHGIGEVPFFPFFNNNIDTNDLANVKPLIDTYCKVFSGFVNDLEDIQEVIFVLTNYGGQNLREFLQDLKDYKAIKLDNDGSGDSSGVSTLTIELPVEAREKLLSITRKCIFEQGQGIDPDPQNFGNSSGVALDFLYALLELKAGLQETEFRLGFGKFIRCICRLMNIPIQDDVITQVWTRTSVKNDLELSQIAQQSQGSISKKTIIAHHPWVENPEEEEKVMEEEEEKNMERMDPYQQSFGQHDGEGEEAGKKDKDDKKEPIKQGAGADGKEK